MLWTMVDDERLPYKARELVEIKENEIFFSVISLWEIQIKHILHPEQMENAETVARYCRVSGYKMLPLTERNIMMLPKLNRPKTAPRHKDPFDKMLICQAAAEDMTLLTHDHVIPQYGPFVVQV